jgi:hypothetical protein
MNFDPLANFATGVFGVYPIFSIATAIPKTCSRKSTSETTSYVLYPFGGLAELALD